MTREIKYRAWDKARNKMFDVTLINFQDKLVNMTYDNKSDWEETKEIIKDYNVPLSRIELMECLEVKDKKGKEIWEGDIVEWIYPDINDDYYKKIDTTFGNIFGIIYWNDEDYSFRVKQISKDIVKLKTLIGDKVFDGKHELEFYDYTGEEFSWNELEVVGNIYENKAFYENELEKYKLSKIEE